MKLRVQYARQLTPAELAHYLDLDLLDLPQRVGAFIDGGNFKDCRRCCELDIEHSEFCPSHPAYEGEDEGPWIR